MNYEQLSGADRDEIRRQKLHAIEADHARLTLDLALAAEVGMTDGDQVTVVRANIAILERQHAHLVDLLHPPEVAVADNGQARTPATV